MFCVNSLNSVVNKVKAYYSACKSQKNEILRK